MPLVHDTRKDLESVIERFEARARAGRAQAIERVLAEVAVSLDRLGRARLLVELVAIDLEYRWQSPHRRGPLIEHYVKRLGAFATLDDVPLELIAEEYRARHRFGDRPAHAAYAARFPRHGQALLDELDRIDEELASEYPWTIHSPSPDVAAAPKAHDRNAPLDYRDYAIRRLIAAGGMSRVYTAVQKSLQQPVALKVLNKQLARNPQSVQRFLREARIAAALDMPNVVNALGLGRFPDGGYFMVLRLIDGLDLTRLAETTIFSEDRALELTRRIAEVVGRVHDRGWLHCDLKPSNVLIDSRGEPWLTDFAMAQPWGNSQIIGSDDDSFALGGTPAFMAPEQLAGDAALLSPASDVFAIGGILHWLLTEKSPGERCITSYDHLTARCAAILRRCLAEQPAERYSSCDALVADLVPFGQ